MDLRKGDWDTIAHIVSRCDGATLLRALEASAERLIASADDVDALNVYPLPDGDTGRNMRRTITAALERARAADARCDAVARAAAEGALRGAQGNSGVILSQILRGAADALDGATELGGDELARALRGGAERAASAISKPARGTMLSFIEEIAAAAASARGDAAAVLRSAVGAADGALARTMAENSMNQAAGVVDAGAYGVWLLLAGAHELTNGERREPPALRRDGARPVVAGSALGDEVAAWSGGSCVQYVVASPARAVDELRADIEALGADSVLVVGGPDLVKVHAHVLQPELALSVGRSAGELEDVIVEDFDEMVAEHERATGIVLASPTRPLAAIAVAPGPGIAAAFRSLGVAPIRGAAGANPSVGDIADAIERANADRVIVLPNDRNVILAAHEAAKLARTRVDVIETVSVAQGVAALPHFEPGSEPDDVVARMRDAAASARSLEVTRATRDATVDGVTVAAGDAIALVDGAVVARASDVIDALVRGAAALGDVGILTVFVGADVDDETRRSAVERLRAERADVEVEVKDGGQPHYPFVVAAE